jgi:hypothetical protein
VRLKHLLAEERRAAKMDNVPKSEELSVKHKSMLEKELIAANSQNERLKKLLIEERKNN